MAKYMTEESTFHHADGRVFKDYLTRPAVLGDWLGLDEDMVQVTAVRGPLEYDVIKHPRSAEIVAAMLDTRMKSADAFAKADRIARGLE